MQQTDLIAEGERIMTICNACRYCEGFCAVFPAMERRLSFAEADMNYLANLCHNCTECVHACQYTSPHPFAVNVSMTLARIRLRSYEKYCWPQALGSAFRLHGVATVSGLAVLLFLVMLGATWAMVDQAPIPTGDGASFYSVIPHEVMVGAFGVVFVLIVTAMAVAVARYVKDTDRQTDQDLSSSIVTGLRDAFTLKYLHGSGESCTIEENVRTPWRRWFHHMTFYGFLLCFAATSVASVYHYVLRWEAPYPFLSLPVILGTLGGVGLLIGPAGLWALRARRDPTTADPGQAGLERAFILLLMLTSATGLALLLFRDSAAMGLLLLVHLALVLTLFVTLPFGKFVHGLYRVAALIRYARESRAT
jgi:citrate/tricarballylate utilization protein